MIDLQAVKIYTVGFWVKVRKFDYTKLIPTYRSEKYGKGYSATFGIELTHDYSGPGLAIGFLKTDYWIGWPKDRILEEAPPNEVLVGEIV